MWDEKALGEPQSLLLLNVQPIDGRLALDLAQSPRRLCIASFFIDRDFVFTC